jgi:hypothetical protein
MVLSQIIEFVSASIEINLSSKVSNAKYHPFIKAFLSKSCGTILNISNK